jgi:hypothetical protein
MDIFSHSRVLFMRQITVMGKICMISIDYNMPAKMEYGMGIECTTTNWKGNLIVLMQSYCSHRQGLRPK